MVLRDESGNSSEVVHAVVDSGSEMYVVTKKCNFCFRLLNNW